MKRTLLSAALLALLVTTASAGNLLQNPGFESGSLSPWFNARTQLCFGTCINWAVTTANPHTGIYSAVDTGNIELRQDFAATPASSINNVSFWVNSAAGVDAFDMFYSDGTDDEFVVFPTPGVWTYEDVTSFLDTTKLLTGFSIFGASPNIVTYVDDANVSTAVPEPGSLLMLGSGLLAAVGALRRKLRA